jgi:hypothetical protein
MNKHYEVPENFTAKLYELDKRITKLEKDATIISEQARSLRLDYNTYVSNSPFPVLPKEQ